MGRMFSVPFGTTSIGGLPVISGDWLLGLSYQAGHLKDYVPSSKKCGKSVSTGQSLDSVMNSDAARIMFNPGFWL